MQRHAAPPPDPSRHRSRPPRRSRPGTSYLTTPASAAAAHATGATLAPPQSARSSTQPSTSTNTSTAPETRRHTITDISDRAVVWRPGPDPSGDCPTPDVGSASAHRPEQLVALALPAKTPPSHSRSSLGRPRTATPHTLGAGRASHRPGLVTATLHDRARAHRQAAPDRRRLPASRFADRRARFVRRHLEHRPTADSPTARRSALERLRSRSRRLGCGRHDAGRGRPGGPRRAGGGRGRRSPVAPTPPASSPSTLRPRRRGVATVPVGHAHQVRGRRAAPTRRRRRCRRSRRTYRFVARYGGDADNPLRLGACNDPNETVVVPRRSRRASGCSSRPARSSRPEPGGTFSFDVDVTNTSAVTITLTGLEDDVYGDVDTQGTCTGAVSTVLHRATPTSAPSPARDGDAGTTQTDILTGTAVDGPGRPCSTRTTPRCRSPTCRPRPAWSRRRSPRSGRRPAGCSRSGSSSRTPASSR